MAVDETTRVQCAAKLREAQRSGEPCEQLTEHHRKLDVADAYAIQRLNVEARLERGLFGRPARIVGRKIGLTSDAIQSWLGVDEPDFGTLLDDMVVEDGGVVALDKLLQPRAEGEVAFVLRRDLAGPGVTAAQVLAATDFVLPAIEIIDSRIADWKIAYEDTVADNASSGMFVVGSTPIDLRGVDLRLAGMALRKNGRTVSTGAGAACLGHPVNAVVWLANKLGEMGDSIRAGEIVLSGALGPVTPLRRGDHLEVEIAHLGRASCRAT